MDLKVWPFYSLNPQNNIFFWFPWPIYISWILEYLMIILFFYTQAPSIQRFVNVQDGFRDIRYRMDFMILDTGWISWYQILDGFHDIRYRMDFMILNTGWISWYWIQDGFNDFRYRMDFMILYTGWISWYWIQDGFHDIGYRTDFMILDTGWIS